MFPSLFKDPIQSSTESPVQGLSKAKETLLELPSKNVYILTNFQTSISW